MYKCNFAFEEICTEQLIGNKWKSFVRWSTEICKEPIHPPLGTLDNILFQVIVYLGPSPPWGVVHLKIGKVSKLARDREKIQK